MHLPCGISICFESCPLPSHAARNAVIFRSRLRPAQLVQLHHTTHTHTQTSIYARGCMILVEMNEFHLPGFPRFYTKPLETKTEFVELQKHKMQYYVLSLHFAIYAVKQSLPFIPLCAAAHSHTQPHMIHSSPLDWEKRATKRCGRWTGGVEQQRK